MPIFRLFRPRIVAGLMNWRPELGFPGKLAQLVPHWIRAAHAENGHQPYKPMYEVDVSESDLELFRDTYWKSLEIHSDLLFSRILVALENQISMDQVLADLRANRPIRVAPRPWEVISR